MAIPVVSTVMDPDEKVSFDVETRIHIPCWSRIAMLYTKFPFPCTAVLGATLIFASVSASPTPGGVMCTFGNNFRRDIVALAEAWPF